MSTFSMYGMGQERGVTKRVLFLCMAWGRERCDKMSTFSMYGLGTRYRSGICDKTSTFSMYGLGTRKV